MAMFAVLADRAGPSRSEPGQAAIEQIVGLVHEPVEVGQAVLPPNRPGRVERAEQRCNGQARPEVRAGIDPDLPGELPCKPVDVDRFQSARVGRQAGLARDQLGAGCDGLWSLEVVFGDGVRRPAHRRVDRLVRLGGPAPSGLSRQRPQQRAEARSYTVSRTDCCRSGLPAHQDELRRPAREEMTCGPVRL
jgi:hypothetical protein